MSNNDHGPEFRPFILRLAENLSSIFDGLYDGIITVDTAGNIQQFNTASEKMTGFSSDEALDRPLHEVLIPRADTSLTERILLSITRRRRIENYELEITTRDGRARTLNITSTVLLGLYEDEPAGAVLSMVDVTEIHSLKQELKGRYKLDRIIGKNHEMQQVYERILLTAGSDSTVLIHGESGTGKELVAHAIHYHSHRAESSFIKVNCSALAETLLESELFGHVKGAFTGAFYDKIGRFEASDGGTIFLDEVGDFSPFIQQKLLRVLQEREFERVGDTSPRKVDVRIIAASNRNLAALVNDGRFRADLYYRLRVIPIELPALRQKKDDLPLLINHFIAQYNEKMGKRIRGVSEEAMGALLRHDWPGNIRELEHAIEHAMVLSPGLTIQLSGLPIEIRRAEEQEAIYPLRSSARTAPAGMERSMIEQALSDAGGNRTRAAKLLGISRTTLWRKMKEYSIS